MSNNFVELLLTLGVNSTTSIANINREIDKLQGKIKELDVTLNVKSNGSETKIITQIGQEILKAQKQTEELGKSLENVGEKSKKKKPKIIAGISEEAINAMSSLKELERYLTKGGYSYKVDMSVDKNGVQKVRHVMAEIKNDFGQIETLKIKPVIDKATGASSFRLYGESLKDVNHRDFLDNQEKAMQSLREMGRVGKLSANDIKDYTKQINAVGDNSSLQKVVANMKELNKEASHETKWSNATKNLNDQSKNTIAILEKLKQSASNLGLDTKQFDVLISKMRSMSNIDITNDAQITKANNAFSKLSSQMSALKNNTSTFETSFKTLNTILDTTSRSGIMSADAIDKIKLRIQQLNGSDLTLDEKVRRLKNEVEQLNQKLSATKHDNKMAESIQKAKNEAEKLDSQLTKVINSYKRTVNMEDVNAVRGTLQGMKVPAFTNTAEVKAYMQQLKQVELQIKRINADATVGARNSMSVLDSFKVAMEKFPIWMAASTAFYGSIRTAREFVSVLIDIDTKLVNISKVLSDDMDMSKIFDQATESATTFAQSISSVLDAYAEFARQGYKGEDIQLMGESALVAGNVGEITPEKAAEYLTSASIQWQKEASDSMSIVDSWNNISNNYATTLTKLAEGHTRVGSVAKALNVDFHELNGMIGVITASTKQSGTEIGNSLKALLPRLTQKVGKNTLASLGVALTDDMGNMRNVIDIYTEVAEKMNDMNEVEKSAVRFGLGGTYHSQRLQVLLDDLGSADSMYRKMYETSVDSAGSAMIENEKYMKSLQARINSAKIEFEKLAVAIGEAFLTSGMIEFLKLASGFLQIMTSMVNSVGVLPIVFGVASMAVLLFSNRAKTLTTALNAKAKAAYDARTATLKYSQSTNQSIVSAQKFTQTANASAVATRRLSLSSTAVVNASSLMNNRLKTTENTMNATRRATTMLATAGRALGSAFVWTIPFVMLGYLIGKLTEARAKTRELRESADSANKEMMSSFKGNQDELSALVGKYSELEKVINSGNYDNATLAEYYDIQNQIGKLMPTLVTGEDEYGNKLVESSDVIKTKIEMLTEQLDLEREVAEWQAKQDRRDRIDGNIELAKESTKTYREELVALMSDLNTINQYSFGLGEFKLDVPNFKELEDVTKFLSEIADKRKLAEQAGNSKAIEYYDKLSKKVIDAQNAVNGSSLVYKNAQSLLRVDYISEINDTLKDNEKLWGNNTNSISTFMGELMKLSDIDSVDTLNDALMSISLNGSAGQEIFDLTKSFGDLKTATDTNFDEIVGKIESSMETVRANLKKSSGLSDTEINAVLEVLNKKLETVKITHAEVIAEMNRSGVSWEEAKAKVSELAEGLGELDDAAGGTVKTFENLTDSISYINGVLEGYAESNTLSASAMLELIDKYDKLLPYINDEAKMIQELEKIRDDDINAAKIQLAEKLSANEEFYDANIKALEQFVEQQFKFYERDLRDFETLAQAKADVEVQLINELAKKWGVYYDEQTKSFQSFAPEANKYGVYDFGNSLGLPSAEDLDKQFKAQKEYSDSLKAFDNFTLDRIELDFSSIGTSLDKASKSTSKSTKENIYITDKFKQALEAVNLEIEKQQAIQAKHPQHSEKYRKSLEAQLKLEREKLKLIQDQASALDKQIKSGKIAQTGSISTDKSSSKSTKINGFNGKQTSGFGNRTHPVTGEKNSFHGGVDLSGSKGSRIDSTTGGKVLSSRNYHSSYGNIVVVQDSNGLKHMYAHLEKVIAKVGDTVTAGQQIGTMGSTGRSTGTHLHYEVRLNDKAIDPSQYITDAKNGVTSVINSTNSAISNTQQSIDEAKSTLSGLQGDVLAQMQTIADLEKAIIDSQLASFDFKRSGYDETIAYEEAKLKNVTEGTDRYTKTLDKQSTLLKAKQRVNNDELAYVEGLIKNGNLSAITLEEMNSRTITLKTSIESLNTEIGRLALDKIYAQYDNYQKKQDNTLDFEKNKLAELDTNSTRYTATLEKINTHLNRKVITTKENIASIEKEIIVSKLQGELLTEAKDKIQELTLSMQQLNLEMSDTNYEIVVNIKTKYDEKVDDLQFEIDRSKVIQGMYKEGSADSANEIKKQIGLYEQMAQAQDDSRRKLQAELNQRNLLPERIKEITELMEDETLAYWNSKSAIEALNKELEETNKRMLEDIANQLISAYKEYVQERQDERMKMLDDEMEAEDEAHEKRMKQLTDEMDLFRKNVEEKLRLIDLQEAERSYDMEMDDLEIERDKLVDQINLLSLDDSHEAKSKKKKLLEQLDKLDIDIAEKRHERDITLQKEALNDLLDIKDEEMQEREELLDEEYQDVVKSIDRQKEYWNKHYTDLLNDERKFAQIREDIMNGHFDKVASEFQGYIQQMRDTMPLLSDTMNGTMASVGTAIRQNVIDNLNEAIKKMNEFNAMQIATNSITDNFNPNASKDTTYSGNTGSSNTAPSTPSNNNSNNNTGGAVDLSKVNLEAADQKVMFAKFLNDVLANTLKSGSPEKEAVKNEAYNIAAQGRAEGSTIIPNDGFTSVFGRINSAQQTKMKNYIRMQASGVLGGKYTSAIQKNSASLITGGMTKWTGIGNDGIGGKLATVHPNEIMLNPLETKDMLQSSSIIQNIMKMITPITSKLPSLGSFNNPSNSIGNVEINLNGTIQNGNGRDARDLVNDMAQEMRTRGMWR